MSRVKRLKRRRKNRIKATVCGLSFSLAIGLLQVRGTYALFTDTVDMVSDLAISTGDVNVEVDEKSFSYDNVQPTSELKHEFTISNNGTLNQNINLGLVSPTEGLPNEIYNCIKSYKVEFIVGEDGNSGIRPIANLKSGVQKLKVNDETGNSFVLNPGQSIKAMVTITMEMTHDQQIKLSGQTLNMKLNVEAVQLDKQNIIDKGFYDIEEQTNSLTIGEANTLQSGEALKVTPADGLGGGKTFTIEFYGKNKYMGLLDIIDKLDGELKLDTLKKNTITVYDKSGAFSESEFEISINGNQVMKAYPVNFDLIKDDYGKGNHIDIKIDYGNGISNIYRIDFKSKVKQGNRLAEAKVTLLEKLVYQESASIELEEPPKEEVEVPSESDVEEQLKEDIEE